MRTTLTIALCLPSLALAQGPPEPFWIEQFGTSGYEILGDVAADGAGGTFAAGTTPGALGGPNAGGQDAFLTRWDGAGGRLWVRQFGTGLYDAAKAVDPDGAGGVFVGGETSGALGGPNVGGLDAFLARYDASGVQLWATQFGTSGEERVYDVAADGAGGAYVVGLTEGSLGGAGSGDVDGYLARYDGAGNQLWIRQFGTTTADTANAVTIDGNGVLVAGKTEGSLASPSSGSWDIFLARYDGAGSPIWQRQLGSSSGDWVTALISDPSGGTYLAGYTLGGLGGANQGSWDAYVARLDGAGNVLWIRQIGTPGVDFGLGAALDDQGGVYLAGSTEGSLAAPSAGDADAYLARYDSGGNPLWIQQFGTSSFDRCDAVATDGAGGVHAAGGTGGILGGAAAGSLDAFLARFPPDCSSNATCGIGTTYCVSNPNSSGAAAEARAVGLTAVAANTLSLRTRHLPAFESGYFLMSANPAFVPGFGNGQGNLCLGPPIVRLLTWPGSILNSGATGRVELQVDLPTLPQGVVVQAGDTYRFQYWTRDGASNNTSSAVAVTFR